jgi:hypothetical protein
MNLKARIHRLQQAASRLNAARSKLSAAHWQPTLLENALITRNVVRRLERQCFGTSEDPVTVAVGEFDAVLGVSPGSYASTRGLDLNDPTIEPACQQFLDRIRLRFRQGGSACLRAPAL